MTVKNSIDQKEFEKEMSKAGFSVFWQTTGSPDWVRGFVQKQENGKVVCQYGRASFYKGVLYNVNFYWRQYANEPINESDYLIYFHSYYTSTGKSMSYEEFQSLVEEAQVLREANYQERLEKRRQTNLLKPKKRPSIKGRCVRRFIEELLIKKAHEEK